MQHQSNNLQKEEEEEEEPQNRIGMTDKASYQLPENWPADVEYLADLTYTQAARELQPKLSRAPSDNISWLKLAPKLIRVPCPLVRITTITDHKHPACGQRGLFAAEHLIPDSFILLYQGRVHCNSLSDTDPHSDYDLSLDRDVGLSCDAARSGNEARCANDYRGIADRPNAEFRDCYVQVPSSKRADGMRWERRVGIFVLSAGKAGLRKAGIKAGEEILLSYGKGYWEGRKTLAKFRNDADMLRIAQAALDWGLTPMKATRLHGKPSNETNSAMSVDGEDLWSQYWGN